MTDADASITQRLAEWTSGLTIADVPADILDTTEQRILDTIGLSILGRESDIGRAVIAGCRTLGGPVEAHILGDAVATGAAAAALANGALAAVFEFDDTHSESVVHVGAAVVAAALAIGESVDAKGDALLVAVAAAAEVVCRLAVVAPGEFHPRGYHPTGIFCPFGAAFAAGSLRCADAPTLVSAAGIVGSQAAGLLACWSDGTSVKALHPGLAAHSGIMALTMAASGVTGPAYVIEGAGGLIPAHLQDPEARFDYGRCTRDLGTTWESRGIALKPYPAAHVLHGLIEAALSISEGLSPGDISSVVCRVAPHWGQIVCEPSEGKRRPTTSAAARISLQHTIAEALVRGRIDAASYSPSDLEDRAIRSLADRVDHEIDPDWVDRSVFPGELRVTMTSGQTISAKVASHLGGRARPLSFDQVAAKFRGNVRGAITADAATAMSEATRALRGGLSVRKFVELVC